MNLPGIAFADRISVAPRVAERLMYRTSLSSCLALE